LEFKNAKKYANGPIFSASNYDMKQLPMLDELNAGILDGLTREEVKKFYSDWYEKRHKDKLRFWYPSVRGEGYIDVTNRLKSVILEVERATDHISTHLWPSCDENSIGILQGSSDERDHGPGRSPWNLIHVGTGKNTAYSIIYTLILTTRQKPYGVEYKENMYNPDSEWFDVEQQIVSVSTKVRAQYVESFHRQRCH
jgi:6-phosphofructo-2-kinase